MTTATDFCDVCGLAMGDDAPAVAGQVRAAVAATRRRLSRQHRTGGNCSATNPANALFCRPAATTSPARCRGRSPAARPVQTPGPADAPSPGRRTPTDRAGTAVPANPAADRGVVAEILNRSGLVSHADRVDRPAALTQPRRCTRGAEEHLGARRPRVGGRHHPTSTSPPGSSDLRRRHAPGPAHDRPQAPSAGGRGPIRVQRGPHVGGSVDAPSRRHDPARGPEQEISGTGSSGSTSAPWIPSHCPSGLRHTGRPDRSALGATIAAASGATVTLDRGEPVVGEPLLSRRCRRGRRRSAATSLQGVKSSGRRAAPRPDRRPVRRHLGGLAGVEEQQRRWAWSQRRPVRGADLDLGSSEDLGRRVGELSSSSAVRMQASPRTPTAAAVPTRSRCPNSAIVPPGSPRRHEGVIRSRCGRTDVPGLAGHVERAGDDVRAAREGALMTAVFHFGLGVSRYRTLCGIPWP